MKRRDLFKMFATLAAMPLVAPLAAWCKPKAEGFTHVQRVTGMRVISTGLTTNDDLFGRVGEVKVSVDSAVRQGAEDHWHHGSTVLDTPNATLFSRRTYSTGIERKAWLAKMRRDHPQLYSGEQS